MLRQVFSVFYQELKLDFRDITSIGSVLLFMVGATFISLKSFITLHGVGWVALYWILLLFSMLNLVMQSFKASRSASRIAQYVYYSAISVVIGKWCYHLFYILLSGLLLWGLMSVFFGSPIDDLFLFGTGLSLGALGLCTVFTVIALITSLVPQAHLLTSILSLPLSLPFILLCIKITIVSSGLIQDTSIWSDVTYLGALTLFAAGLGLLLLPTLWKS